MTKEQLERGRQIQKDIDSAKENIKKADYTQCDHVVIRESYLKFNGIDSQIEIPKSLFRVIGKLILLEYNQQLIDLEKEFESL